MGGYHQRERAKKERLYSIPDHLLLLFLGGELLLVLAFLILDAMEEQCQSGLRSGNMSYVRGILVLLVLSNQILHVGLRLSELSNQVSHIKTRER